MKYLNSIVSNVTLPPEIVNQEGSTTPRQCGLDCSNQSTCSLAICSLPEVSPDLFPVIADSRTSYCEIQWYRYNSDLCWDR